MELQFSERTSNNPVPHRKFAKYSFINTARTQSNWSLQARLLAYSSLYPARILHWYQWLPRTAKALVASGKKHKSFQLHQTAPFLYRTRQKTKLFRTSNISFAMKNALKFRKYEDKAVRKPQKQPNAISYLYLCLNNGFINFEKYF